MTTFDWSKADQCIPDPARVQRQEGVLPPDETVITVSELTPEERRRTAKRVRSNEILHKELKAEEARHRRKRRARNKAIFKEDEIREAKLKAESDERRALREVAGSLLQTEA